MRAVLELGHAREVLGAARRFEILPGALELFLDVRGALHRGFLGLPDLLEIRVFLLERLELLLQRGEPLARSLVGLLLQSLTLDLQLDDAPVEPVERLGLRVDLHPDQRSGLVDQVDGLVRQLPIGDVAMRQCRRSDDGGVGDLDAVVDLVALLEAAQDGDGVLHRRLVHQHLLEAPLERRILLDVLAVLIERRRADAMQLAARERGLEHVAGIHGALGFAGADHGMQLVDEQDDPPFLLGEIGEHGLQALLELAAEFRAGNESAHVEREDALVAQAFRHLAVDDALRETLDDRRLADAGLADEHGIVLGAPLQDLDGATDLIVAADDRIELALPSRARSGRCCTSRAPGDSPRRRHRPLLRRRALPRSPSPARRARARGLQDAPELAAILDGGQHKQLARDELIAALLRELIGQVEQLVQIVADHHIAARTLHRGQPIERRCQLRTQLRHIGARLLEQRPRGATFLIEQRRHEVRRLDVLIVTTERQRLGIRQGGLEFGRQLVHAHGSTFRIVGMLL